jgi:hypothetical protein
LALYQGTTLQAAEKVCVSPEGTAVQISELVEMVALISWEKLLLLTSIADQVGFGKVMEKLC